MQDCTCGGWACIVFLGCPHCLSCAYRRRVGQVRPILSRPSEPKPTPLCGCRHDEACDVCYATKEAALMSVRP